MRNGTLCSSPLKSESKSALAVTQACTVSSQCFSRSFQLLSPLLCCTPLPHFNMPRIIVKTQSATLSSVSALMQTLEDGCDASALASPSSVALAQSASPASAFDFDCDDAAETSSTKVTPALLLTPVIKPRAIGTLCSTPRAIAGLSPSASFCRRTPCAPDSDSSTAAGSPSLFEMVDASASPQSVRPLQRSAAEEWRQELKRAGKHCELMQACHCECRFRFRLHPR